jgi:subtilisin family serine protease
MAVVRSVEAGAGSTEEAAGGGGQRRSFGFLGCLLAAGLLAPTTAHAAPSAPASPPTVAVIVRESPGAGDRPESAVAEAGGRVLRPLPIISGFLADVPKLELPGLRLVPGVHSVTPDTAVQLHDADESDALSEATSVRSVAAGIGASELWADGLTGRGVDVALIDSGVVPVNGLRTPGKLVFGPDLSLEAAPCDGAGGCAPNPVRHLDSFGHGTHLAGIIAGRDDAVSDAQASADDDEFLGVAPDARLVSVKVADASGATDVSQVIAAIDWVVQHRNRGGLNIRVLNLAFGTDSVQDYRLDPLAFAAEVAWRKGIVVVVAAGNDEGAEGLDNPAHDPYVLAVAGADGRGTPDPNDDEVATWSSRGDGRRNPDLTAPGTRVVSLRNPGSHLDARFPRARQGDRFFRGSGTSQAAAVVSGTAALLLQQRPDLTPDQLKALLTSTAHPLASTDVRAQGAGMLDASRASSTPTPTATQRWPRANGSGSLEAARGSRRVAVDGKELWGEVDNHGHTWNGHTWNGHTWNGHTWNGHTWNGHTWNGHTWNGHTWNGHTW